MCAESRGLDRCRSKPATYETFEFSESAMFQVNEGQSRLLPGFEPCRKSSKGGERRLGTGYCNLTHFPQFHRPVDGTASRLMIPPDQAEVLIEAAKCELRLLRNPNGSSMERAPTASL